MLYFNSIGFKGVAHQLTVRNYRNTFLKDSTGITVVSHVNALVVEYQNERCTSRIRLQRILFHSALNAKPAVWFATFTLSDFVNVALEVNCRCKELGNNESTGRNDHHQHGHIFPFAIVLARSKWRIVGGRARS